MEQTDNIFAPETDCWQLSMVLCMLLHVNNDPHIVSQDPKRSGIYGHSENHGQRRAHFAVLRQAVDELGIFLPHGHDGDMLMDHFIEVDFVKRLHAVDPRQRLTMRAALQHPYLNPNRRRRVLRSRVVAY